MSKTRTTTKATDQQVIKDRAEFCQTLDDIARKGVELDTLQAAKEAAMQKVLTDHDPRISELTKEIDRLTEMAEQLCLTTPTGAISHRKKIEHYSPDHLWLSPGAALPQACARLDLGQGCCSPQGHPPQGIPCHQGDPGQGGNPPAY